MNERFQIEVPYVAATPDESFWRGAPGYLHAYSLDMGGVPREEAVMRFAWNERGLYVHAELEDSFVVATDRRDEQLHFETGDVFELFVKPLDADYYWEMYATPFGNKTTLFFPRDRAGMEVENFLRDHEFHGLEVSSEITDTGWSADLFVPAGQLTALGADWLGATEWTVLCGRYNYNNDELADPELSMLPPVSKTNYHLTKEYARLVALKGE
jgi:hypothetical protein